MNMTKEKKTSRAKVIVIHKRRKLGVGKNTINTILLGVILEKGGEKKSMEIWCKSNLKRSEQRKGKLQESFRKNLVNCKRTDNKKSEKEGRGGRWGGGEKTEKDIRFT